MNRLNMPEFAGIDTILCKLRFPFYCATGFFINWPFLFIIPIVFFNAARIFGFFIRNKQCQTRKLSARRCCGEVVIPCIESLCSRVYAIGYDASGHEEKCRQLSGMLHQGYSNIARKAPDCGIKLTNREVIAFTL